MGKVWIRNDLAMKLCDIGVDIGQEEDASRFLGFNLECYEETGILEMNQPGLIDCVISAVIIDVEMDKWKYTPAGSITLANN